MAKVSKFNLAQNQAEEEEENMILLQLLAEGGMEQTKLREKEKEMNSPSVGVLSQGAGAGEQPSVEETLPERK